jgi:hypothetical protein
MQTRHPEDAARSVPTCVPIPASAQLVAPLLSVQLGQLSLPSARPDVVASLPVHSTPTRPFRSSRASIGYTSTAKLDHSCYDSEGRLP